jgi:hypothetical protein
MAQRRVLVQRLVVRRADDEDNDEGANALTPYSDARHELSMMAAVALLMMITMTMTMTMAKKDSVSELTRRSPYFYVSVLFRHGCSRMCE